MHKALHHMDAVADATEQHTLVAQRNTCVGQHFASALRLCGHLVGLVEVGVNPDGVILLQHGAEFWRDALRADHRRACSQAYNLHVRYLAQTRDDVFQALVADHQGIAARQQHVAHALCLLDILQCFLDAVGRALVVGLSGKAATCAVTAVHRTHIGDEEEHAVGITMRQSGCRRVFVLVQRVEQVGCSLVGLQTCRNALTTDGIVRVVGIDQTQVVGSDGHTQRLERLANTLLLLFGQRHIFFQLFKGLDAVSHLPFPVVPLLVADVGEHLFSS